MLALWSSSNFQLGRARLQQAKFDESARQRASHVRAPLPIIGLITSAFYERIKNVYTCSDSFETRSSASWS